MSTDNERYRWVLKASCQGMALEDFFIEAGHVAKASVVAKCKSCPVRRQCVTDAYESGNSSSGYRGGFSPSNRRDLSLEHVLDIVSADEVEIAADDARRQAARR